MIGGNPVYQAYVEILKRELICAMGCTEPIALASTSAECRRWWDCVRDTLLEQPYPASDAGHHGFS